MSSMLFLLADKGAQELAVLHLVLGTTAVVNENLWRRRLRC